MEGAYQRARQMYSTLTEDPKTAAQARRGEARCHLQVGSYEDALQTLTSLPDRQSAAWHCLVADAYEKTGRLKDALTHARAAIAADKGSAGARLRLGRLLETVGQRDEAVEVYRWFDRQLVEREQLPSDAAWMTDAAVGFVRYSVLTQTNLAQRIKHALKEMLQPAYERLDRSYWPARIAAADLLRERFNNDEQDGSLSDYQAALRINENLPEAHVGIGEVMLSAWNFEDVERRAELALAINPRHAPAIHLLGKKFLLERRYDQAYRACEPALDVNPNDITALSIQAAAKACRFDDGAVEKLAERVTAIDPRPSTFYRILGDALGGIRQYASSERAYLLAIEHDPTDANARTELGMMYMQWGLEDKARHVLEAAWALDPFNERTHFTMELFEDLSGFHRVESAHFVVKHDARKDPGLGEFVVRYLEDIYEIVTEDYDTPIDGRTIIEFFPTHRAFGVRITGKPWIHTVGAATGRVIALASPRDSAHVQPYNLARVLKHEFTHTVTLEATRNRIPHWFTEGLAVHQEDGPRSFRWVQALADAARRDRLFTLASIDWGFMRPRRAGDRQLAYAQSEWMCEYIIERFGYDTINAMLRRFSKGETQRTVFTELMHIDPESFDGEFLAWAKRQARGWGFDLTPPEPVQPLQEQIADRGDDAELRGRLAKAEFDAGNLEGALDAAKRTLELDENEPRGLTVFVSILAELADGERDTSIRRSYEDLALPALERLLDVDPNGWTAPRFLADIRLRRREYDRAEPLYHRLQRLCPMDPGSWRGLAGIYLVRNDYDRALPQLTELATLAPDDADTAAQIAKIYRRRGRLGEAQYWFRIALYVDPFSINLHQSLGDTQMQAGDARAAMSEYDILTKLEPDNAARFEAAALAAHKLGETDRARSYARRAIELNPSSSARSLVP